MQLNQFGSSADQIHTGCASNNIKIYIDGVGAGFSWANAELERTGRPPLYCDPIKMPLQAENYLQILQDYIQKNKELIERCGSDCPVEMLLLHGLIETLSCE